MAVRFSSRVDVDDMNAIARAEAEAHARGLVVRRLNDANPTAHGLAPERLASLYEADPRGPRDMRRVLADFMTRRGVHGSAPSGAVDPSRLYVLGSTSQAYSWLFDVLCDPGDRVLAPKPGYPLVDAIARLEGVGVEKYRLAYDGSWTIDLATVRSHLQRDGGGRIKALVLINPNNPTGSYVKPEERGELVSLCRRHGVAIIADEVFYEYGLDTFAGNARLSGETGALTFALDGLSKLLAAPHAKVGWIHVSGPDHDVAEAQRRLDAVADAYLPMSAIVAQRMEPMLDQAVGQIARVGGRIRGNIDLLTRMVRAQGSGLATVLRAEGGWNALLRVPCVVDDDTLVLTLMDRHGITGQPGYFFDMDADGYLAVSLLPEPRDFERLIADVLDTVDDLCLGSQG